MAKPLALIIEDQTNLAMLYEDALRLVGYDIFAIDDGLKALNHLETHNPPDLIILDVNLPNLSGKDIHKHIRGSQKYIGVPVIILTANTLMIEQMRPLTGKDDHLYIKPIGMRELQELAKSLQRDDEGTPSFMAETQKVPHLEDDADTEEMKTKTNPPTILRPDNSVMEDSEHTVIDPKAKTQEHKTIITPEDDIIAQDDTGKGVTD